MIPRNLTVALIEDEELEPAREWARRAGVELTWDPRSLEIRAVFTQRTTAELFFLLGRLEGYKAIPPAWDFCDHAWGSPGSKCNYPARASLRGIGSIFHTNPVICAPFNRLAYQTHGGPHGDWGGPEQWLKAAPGSARADTLADMLALIARDMSNSNGRMN
ncbi:MAG: hypothetical protein WD942_04365 [Dehalococcoidia bacterium]